MSFSASWRTLGNLFLWGVIPLLIGWWLALQVVPKPTVGLIRLNTDIWAGSAELIRAEIKEARQDPSIKAIVVQIDSPGGEVVASQTIYLELQKLRQEMPVVGSIDGIAASGAFYAAMAADPLYAKPSSKVGNVGVWAFAPPDLGVNDVVIASGPFKLTADNQAEFLRGIDGIKQEFLATVTSQRDERLKTSPVDLSQGLAYPGREALRLGLIDHLGSQTEAIAAAAEQAGIANYEVVDLEPRAFKTLQLELGVGVRSWGEDSRPSDGQSNSRPSDGQSKLQLEPWAGAADPVTGRRHLPPGAYLLYDVQLGGQP